MDQSPRPLRSFLTALAAAAMVMSIFPVEPSSALASSESLINSTNDIARTWAPTFMSNHHGYTRQEALALARRFDVVASIPISFPDHAAAMRAENTRLRLLVYANATFSSPSGASGYPDAWFAKDVGGRRITSTAFGNYLMEPSNTNWRNEAARLCAERANAGRADGCLYDMLTMGIYSRGYVSALPRKPGTTREYTQSEWRDLLVATSRRIQEENPGIITVGNAISNAWRYWNHPVSSRPIAMSLPGPQVEDFLRGATDAANRFPTEERWRQYVEIIRDLEANGRAVFATTKLWLAATQAEVRRWHAYAMASFLMGANGRSYFAFTSERSKAGASGANHLLTMPRDLGAPSGGYRRLGNGAYDRVFVNGRALVNPTSSTVTVNLGSSHRLLNGREASSVTLPPNSGEVAVLVSGLMPTVSVTSPSDGTTVDTSPVVLTGEAHGLDSGFGAVHVAVRNNANNTWLNPDGS